MTDGAREFAIVSGAEPTMAMGACMRHLVERGCYLRKRDKMPAGFEVVNQHGGLVCWYPARVGYGLQRRGWVDEHGLITASGRAALNYMHGGRQS